MHLNATHALPLLTMRSARLESEDLLPTLKMEKVNGSKACAKCVFLSALCEQQWLKEGHLVSCY